LGCLFDCFIVSTSIALDCFFHYFIIQILFDYLDIRRQTLAAKICHFFPLTNLSHDLVK
jgi:hypothetical protein